MMVFFERHKASSMQEFLVFHGHFFGGFAYGCPKLFQCSVWEKLRCENRDWFLDANAMITALEHGYDIYQVDVTMKARHHGTSKVNIKTSLEFVKISPLGIGRDKQGYTTTPQSLISTYPPLTMFPLLSFLSNIWAEPNIAKKTIILNLLW